MTNGDEAVYGQRYVALLDVLGFSALVEQADQQLVLRDFIRETIRSIRTAIPADIDHSGFRSAQFSDTIVLSARRDPAGLLTIFSGCTILSDKLLERSLLMRGGIAAGPFQHDSDLMFGPALLLAHRHDRPGGPPHIALDETVLRDMNTVLAELPFARFRAADPWDLSPMLHTLRKFSDYRGPSGPRDQRLEKVAIEHAALIARRAEDMRRPAAVRAKWRWLQDYWNRSVDERSHLARSGLEVDYSALVRSHASRFGEQSHPSLP